MKMYTIFAYYIFYVCAVIYCAIESFWRVKFKNGGVFKTIAVIDVKI